MMIRYSVVVKIYPDSGVDHKKLIRLQKQYGFTIVRGHRTETQNSLKKASIIGEPFTIGVSILGGSDRLVGDNYKDVEKVIGKDNKEDIMHIYSAYMDGCDFFITNNPDDFIRQNKNDLSGKRRLKLEAILQNIKIVTIEEFSEILAR